MLYHLKLIFYKNLLQVKRGIKISLKNLAEILYVSTKLGLTSFGGPIAHLGYFHNEYVIKRKWIDEKTFNDLVALCQFLPGPASSQTGFGIGMIRGGLIGGIISWVGFTLPSAIILTLFAFFLQDINLLNAGWIYGLKLVAVAIVAQAIFTMGQKFSNNKISFTIMVIACAISLLWKSPFSQIVIIILSGISGFYLFKNTLPLQVQDVEVKIKHEYSIISLLIFFILLILFPILSTFYPNIWLQIINIFYNTGAFVFGGGHVVLPLLENKLIPLGLITKDKFLAGYGIAQAIPGPLFTFSAYIGAVISGWKGAVIATISIFLPSLLLVAGVFPFWDSIRKKEGVQGTLAGINACVVGILLSAFYNPIWVSSIFTPKDFIFALSLFTLNNFWNISPFILVVISVIGGILFY